MAIEFLLVTFPEERSVLADGKRVGFTNHTFMLPGDEYEITLDGGGCLPASQVIALAGTSIVNPMAIAFVLAATRAAARRSRAPERAEAEASEPAMARSRGTSMARGAKRRVGKGARKSASKSARKSAPSRARAPATGAKATKAAKARPRKKAKTHA